MDGPFDPREILRIGWRRRWYLILPAALVMAGALAVALMLPSVYRSTATILVDDQEIPDDLVVSVVGDFVERRLETLTRRILVSDNLLRLAERHDLYAEQREVMSPAQVAQMMRDNIAMEVIQTDIDDPESGRSGLATVAFQLSFEDSDPVKAQRVTNELVSLYLQTNLEQRRAAAAGATSFLAGERARMDQQIAQLEQELLAFQSANAGLLPDDAVLAQEQLIRLEQELRAFDGDTQSLREQEAFLRTQLALTDEFMPQAAGGGVTPASALEIARAELATARARYAPNHPDVLRLEREVRSLQQVAGGGGGTDALLAEQAALQSELAALRQRYTPSHPDVVRVERQLASVRQALAQSPASSGGGAVRSPAYVQLSAQLNAVQSQLSAVELRRSEARAEVERLRQTVARAPAVNQDYERLRRALDEAVATREDLVVKEAAAQLSQSLETGAGGERLSLIEPPVFPEQPVRPNRRLIMALGLVIGLGSGLGAAALAELLDRSVRSARQLAGLIGEKPLVMIPVIVTGRQLTRRWMLRFGMLAVLLAMVVGALAVVHRSYVPLDVLAYQAQNQANSWLTRTFPGDAAAPTGQE